MNDPPVDPRIERARALYVESDIPTRTIAQRLGISLAGLKRWVDEFGWPKRGMRRFGHPSRQTGAKPSPRSAAGSSAPGKPAGTAEPSAKRTGTQQSRRTAKRKRPTTKALVARLYTIINHHIEVMESRMSDDDQTTQGDNPEREARAIGNLVRSVEKLKELEPDHSKRDAGNVRHSRYPLSPGEEEKLRDEIVDRLLRLRERLGRPRTD